MMVLCSMGKPTFHGRNRTLTASLILGAVADDLAQIKDEDGLTLLDIGRVLGKSDDQAGKYCLGAADMGLVSYSLGRREWNGRFSGRLDRLIADARGETGDDQSKLSALLKAATAVAQSLEGNGIMDAGKVRDHRAVLEAASDAISSLLERPALKVVQS